MYSGYVGGGERVKGFIVGMSGGPGGNRGGMGDFKM